jgi:hypothetical protein
MMPAAMIAATASPALADVGKRGHDDLRQLRLGHQLDGDFGDHAEHAFGTDHQRQQVVAGRIRRFRADLENLALDADDADAQHVMHGQPVFQAMHAARVFGDVAAQRAGDLRRGIGRVIEAERGRRFRYRQVAHAGLDDGQAGSRSTRKILLKRASDSTTPCACGIAPPDSPVPAPRATTGTPSW